ncbi:hypothetical protein UlMin_032010 [Ulmus minor]
MEANHSPNNQNARWFTDRRPQHKHPKDSSSQSSKNCDSRSGINLLTLKNNILKNHQNIIFLKKLLRKSLLIVIKINRYHRITQCLDEGSKTSPLMLVTASVNKVVLKKPISVNIDLKINKKAEARNKPRKSKKLLGLVLSWEVKNRKIKALLGEGLNFYDMPSLAVRDSILLSETRLESLLICQPQHRNMHGKIFGGLLMHRAFELAFSTAYAFAGLMPLFLEVNQIDFLRAVTARVEVGDFVRFRSCVLYTKLENPDQPLINVEVIAYITRPEQRFVSNTFYTFSVRQEAKMMKNKFRIKKVIPATEEEARRMIEHMEA